MSRVSDGKYPVDEVASAWLIKMRGEDARNLRAEFDAWLSASPDHRDAYQRAERRMSALAVLKPSQRHGPRPSDARRGQIGSASDREGVCQHVLTMVVAGKLKIQNQTI